MKKLIIFDLDGTLINTLFDLKNAVNHALFLQNLPEIDLEKIRISIGNGVRTLIRRCAPENISEEQYKRLYNDFEVFYQKHCSDFTIEYEGTKELINKLKADGYKIAVATNKLIGPAKELLLKLFGDVFDYIQGDDGIIPIKPAIGMIDNICKNLAISKKDSLYIGDTNVDMQTAVNSKIDYCLVTYGYRTLEELNSQCPESKKIANTNDLYSFIREL